MNEAAPDFVRDVLSAYLGEVGFDSFEETARGVNAYCPADLYDNSTLLDIINNVQSDYDCQIVYREENVEDQNWNAIWEQNSFEPITVCDRLAIYPSSHKTEFANADFEYKIELNPVQAFGSGYHETTRMMLGFILDSRLDGHSVLDMGCGTAVLAILAKMRGANSVTAIDIDHWSAENAAENALLNNVSINVLLGDADTMKSQRMTFDAIFANINRNILTTDMAKYASVLAADGALYMSGFYSEDLAIIDDAASQFGLSRVATREDNNWVAAKYAFK